jgi:hypothetical protein
MLPKGNQIAESVYEAKKIICHLGIEVEKIHACKNSCVLFHGDYADLDKYPKCGYDLHKCPNVILLAYICEAMSPCCGACHILASSTMAGCSP